MRIRTDIAAAIAATWLATLATVGHERSPTRTANDDTRPTMATETILKKLTPILYVEEIEPALPFWVDRLGFEVTAEVPEGDRLGFVILARDGVEVMYQTRESVESDLPSLADSPMRGSILFVEVDDIDAIERALDGIEPVVPRRKTFYGADEIFVREPAGNIVGFAEFGESEG